MKRVLPIARQSRPAVRPESNSRAAPLGGCWGPPPLHHLGEPISVKEAKLNADHLRYRDFFTVTQRPRGLRFSVQPVYSHQEHGRHRDEVHSR